MNSPLTSITIIVAPYHVGIYDHRVGGGPLRLLAHGLADKLEKFAPISYTNIGPVDDFEGEIGRTFEIMRRISKAVSKAVADNSFPLVLSGNCYGSTATVAGVRGKYPDVAALWLDSHDDLDTPSTHQNGYLDAMAASMMVGTSWHKLMETVAGHEAMDPKRLVYCGLRDVSEFQREAVEQAGVDMIWGDDETKVDFTKELAALLDRRALGPTHVHLDLDVLDVSLGRVNDWPSPGGFLADDLMSIMPMITKKSDPTSLVVCQFDPRLEGGDTVARLAVQAVSAFFEGLKERKILA